MKTLIKILGVSALVLSLSSCYTTSGYRSNYHAYPRYYSTYDNYNDESYYSTPYANSYYPSAYNSYNYPYYGYDSYYSPVSVGIGYENWGYRHHHHHHR